MIEDVDVVSKIKKQIEENNVILYMKGSPNAPECGFSAQVVKVLQSYGKPFSFVNILENPDIRATLPKIANWPTFPQLWVNGELVGGCDIICEMHEDGELQELLNEVKN